MNLSCPLPLPDADIITLGHGSGGLLTHRLLNSGVFDILKNEWLNQQHDGAFLHLNGPVAFSTDSYVISPLFFPGGNIGDLAINGTVNDLAMCGAAAQYLSLSFIIEEGLPIQTFREILYSIRDAANTAQIHIVTGDTKVVERGKGDQIFINTSGIGTIHPQAAIHHHHIQPGDCILLSGPIANHGVTILSLRQGLRFETSLQSDTRCLKHTISRLLTQFGHGIKFLRDPTRGGVASVLNEIAEQTTLGLSLNQAAIPIEEEVESACEMLGLDPLYVANEGLFLAIVPPDIADACLAHLHTENGCSKAAIIGKVTTELPGKVILQSRVGGRRIVNLLTGEQLPRIC